MAAAGWVPCGSVIKRSREGRLLGGLDEDHDEGQDSGHCDHYRQPLFTESGEHSNTEPNQNRENRAAAAWGDPAMSTVHRAALDTRLRIRAWCC